MSAQKYIKCPCRHCGGAIEFPAEGIGLAVACPHCQSKTTLFAPARPPEDPEAAVAAVPPDPAPANPDVTESGVASGSGEETEQRTGVELSPAPKRTGLVLKWFLLCVAVAGGTVGALFWFGKQPSPGEVEVQPEPTQAPPPAAPTPNPPAAASASNATPKSIEELKVGDVKLEKAKGNSLVHAVGILRNDSPHQRFGVRLELELTDAKGNIVGVAKDYRSVLEPGQEWHFRALVLDPKAVTAKVARIREDE